MTRGGASEPLHPEQNTSAALRGMNRALGGIYDQPSKRTAQWCPAAPSAVIFPIQLKPEGVDTSVLLVANRSRCYPNLKSLVNLSHLGIGGGTGGEGTGPPG